MKKNLLNTSSFLGGGPRHIKKRWDQHFFFRLMRITVAQILLISITMGVSSAGDGFSQEILDRKVSLELTSSSLKEALTVLEKQAKVKFVYSASALELTGQITLNVSNQKLSDVLDSLLTPRSIMYVVKNKIHIVLKPAKEKQAEAVFENVSGNPDQDVAQVVSGTVTDAISGDPIPGVNVVVKGTTNGTSTDPDGKYSLLVSEVDAILVFSFIGYTTQEVAVSGKSVIDVILLEDVKNLDEVVIVGYGTTKKSDLTGSVVSVKSEDFAKQVTTNALQLLSGKASGVVVSQSNSEPGGELTIRIRGAGSINSSNEVLIVVDGLPGADPSSIHPSDIESIEILKDASAAAIYGTRAANGVVLITTKKGNVGESSITYNTFSAFQKVADKLDVLDARQYMNMRNYISEGLGSPLPFTQEQLNSSGEGTNWQDELFRNAWAFDHQLSLRGGSENSKYYVSLGYLDQEGIMISSGLKRYSTSVNLETTPGERFKFGFNLNGMVSLKDIVANTHDNNFEYNDPLNVAIQFDPTVTTGTDVNGEYFINPFAALDNPVAIAHGFNDNEQRNSVFGNTYVEYKIFDDLKVSARVGGKLNMGRYDSYKDRKGHMGRALGGIGNITSSANNYWLLEGLITYDKLLSGIHRISIVGGATREKFINSSQYSAATGFLSDVTYTNFMSSGSRETFEISSFKNNNKLESLFSRVNYSLKDRYLLTATLRRDGSSRFSSSNKYALFPSIAVGWRMSEERFLNESPILSNLKIRAGYGQVGNEGISNFETIQTFIVGGNSVLGGAILTGAQPARIPNPELRWETTEGYNFGVDFGIFNDRIIGNIEYYVNNSVDQLFNKPVPMSTGFSSVRTNFGKVRNSGIDLSITSRNSVGKFRWTTSAMISTLHNEVVELPPFVGEIITTGTIGTFTNNYALVQEGYPMYAYYGYKINGIFQESDDIAGSPQPEAKPGYPQFYDKNGDGRISADDRVVLGSPFPDLTFSINNSLGYGNFNLEIFLIGVKGIETLNSNVIESLRPQNVYRNILTKHYIDRWTPDNPNAEFPSGINSPTYFSGGREVNSYSVQDASFIRLRNVTLSYNFPLNDIKIFKSLSLYFSAENLVTITNFDGFDPDANQSGTGVSKTSYNNYPLAKVFRLGASVNF